MGTIKEYTLITGNKVYCRRGSSTQLEDLMQVLVSEKRNVRAKLIIKNCNRENKEIEYKTFLITTEPNKLPIEK